MGIEMIQKESALGTSSMMETAPLSVGAGNRTGAHIIKVQGVQSARVHLLAEAVGVSARRAQGHASVMLQLYPGRRPGARTGRGYRASGRIERAGTRSGRRHPGGSSRIAAQFPDESAEVRGIDQGIRIHAQARGELSAADHRTPGAHRRPRACARNRHGRPRLPL